MTRKHVLAALCVAGIAWGATPAAAEDVQALKAEAAGLVKMFFGELKGALMGAVETGGPASAIGVCNEKAPSISAGIAEKSGWSVGRTSLKLRQPNNEADAWELAVLNDFERRKAAGEDTGKLVAAEVVERDDRKVFRFMKAIPTAELCLACHGDTLDAEVAAELDDIYPDDQARGYTLNDLRGAFSLEKPL